MRRPLTLLAAVAALAAGTCAAATPPPNVAVTGGALGAEGGSLAVDPTDLSRLAVAYSTGRSGPTGSCLVARSLDGGRTWERETVAGGVAGPLPSGATHCSDAVLAFGPEGTLYLAYGAARLGGPGRVYLTSSTDHGATFAGSTAVAGDPPGGGDFEPAIAAGPSPGTVSVAFERHDADFEQAAVLAVSSDDSGRTLRGPVRVSPVDQNAVNGRAATAADRGGNLYVAWVDASDVDFEGSGSARLEAAVSRDGGRTFAAPATVASVASGCGPNEDCGNRYPVVAVAAGAEGVADLAWSAAEYPDPARIFVARSRDTGGSWTAPTGLPVPAGAADHDQIRPKVAVAPDGRVDVGWADEARDADAGLLDVHLAHSLDGARSFSSPTRLDAVPSNTRAAFFTAAVDVAASNGAAHAVWQNAGADPSAGSEVFFARVLDASPPRTPTVEGPRHVRGARPSFRLRSSDDFTPPGALRFRCAFDGAAFHPCGARYAQTLRRGRHVLRVRALDGAGKLSRARSVVVQVG